jgi:hypothetical protein
LAASAAALVVSLRRIESRWIGLPRATRFAGLISEARISRSRFSPSGGCWLIEWRL